MRIPSQFNQDSLYRPQSRPRGSQSDQRRMLRLILALVLVLVVMQQASRPELYRVFFGSQDFTTDLSGDSPALGNSQLGNPPPGNPQDPPQGATFTTLADSREASRGRDAIPEDSQASQSSEVESMQDRSQAVQLVQDLLPTDQRQWTLGLSRWIAGRPIPLVPSSIESVQIRLNELEQLDESQRFRWHQMLQSFAQTATAYEHIADEHEADDTVDSSIHDATVEASKPAIGALEPTPDDRGLAMALLAAIDQQASSRVVDGSVWRSGDFDSLYRFLDQSDQHPQSGVTRTSVIPLLQQPDVFRNQWVSIHGRVARVERIEAQDNPYAITHYWQIWLRPNDGADRPMVAIVRDVPEAIAAISATASKLEGPEVVVVGRFLKRLAYTSGLGADLAPVVVGRIIASPRDASASSSDQQAPSTSPSWATILAITIACVIGVLAAALVMWQTAASARRGRELRTSHRMFKEDA